MRQREYPLPQWTFGEYPLGQQRSGLGHAPRTTGGAEPALLAAERDELLGVARVATQAEEAFLQTTALQVGVKLLLDVVWKRSACFGSKRAKRGMVLLHQLIQQRGCGAMPGVARRIEKWRRALSPRTGGDGHGGCPCDGRGRSRL